MYLPAYPKKITKFKKIKNNNIDNLFYFRSASNALYFYLTNIQKHTNNIIYIPSFICRSVSDVAYEAGFKIIFYDLHENLSPKIDINLLNKGDVVVFVNYFGFNINPITSLHKYLEKKIHIILDNSHQMPTDEDFFNVLPVAKIFSLWKTLPVSEGGVLVYNNFNKDLQINRKDFKIHLIKYTTQKIQLISFLINLNLLFLKDKLKGYLRRKLKNIINQKDFSEGPFKSPLFLKYIDFDIARSARINNYKYLMKNIKKIKNINIMFEEISNGTIPFTLPIATKNAKSVVTQIRQYGVECFMWPYEDLPSEISIENYDVLKYWYQNVIHLPIQQNFKRKHLDRIIYAINKTIKS
tara:strand:+ start:811 stop:1869 length:1059 start_codon:yes stop_codon:yes gene_type:complete